MPVKSSRDIISDAEINLVHGNANFGLASNREVVDEAIMQTAVGYHTGYTARRIIIDHGLAKSQKDIHKPPVITAKGREYIAAVAWEKIYGTT